MKGLDESVAQMRKNALLIIFALVAVVGLLGAMIYGARTLKQSQISKNERHAREIVEMLNQALETYKDKYGGYPNTLARLGGLEDQGRATPVPERARLLLPHRAEDRFEESGFRFQYQAGQPTYRYAATVQLFNSYRVTAEPVSVGGSGERFFYSDQTGTVRSKPGAPAGPDDPPV